MAVSEPKRLLIMSLANQNARAGEALSRPEPAMAATVEALRAASAPARTLAGRARPRHPPAGAALHAVEAHDVADPDGPAQPAWGLGRPGDGGHRRARHRPCHRPTARADR